MDLKQMGGCGLNLSGLKEGPLEARVKASSDISEMHVEFS
jgi:hypothetical protein